MFFGYQTLCLFCTIFSSYLVLFDIAMLILKNYCIVNSVYIISCLALTKFMLFCLQINFMPITQSSKLKNLPANSKEQYGPNTEGWPHLLYWGMDLHFQQCHNALLPLSWKNSIKAELLTCYTCIYLGKTTPKKK